ncbi:Phosphoserine aminotransferase [Peptoniphilus sp. ING2-D1G]|nr:Phosphoserine aminotransferase [Peptoniphilus sp. ING2-D1G]
MERIYNFSAGPATLPIEVLKEASEEMLNYRGCGMSVMEMSHRSAEYDEIHQETKALLKELLNLDDNHELLFLQGGASTQFAMVPMNILSKDDKASYVISGSWAKKAYKEAKLFGNIEILASSEDENFTCVPKINEDEIDKESKYLYLCINNTIYGTRISPQVINSLNTKMVADMSSNILSEEYDVNKFEIFFAGAQKNLGPSGLTIVGINKDFLPDDGRILPTMFDYRTHIEKDSLYNTPPCYSIYICGLVMKWLKNLGGVKAIQKINEEKANLLYDFIDNSKLYKNNIKPEERSLMNVVFVTGDKDLDAAFVKGAKEKSIIGIKGHRSVGGMRASIYNAMPMGGVRALVDYMKDFEMQNS